MRNPDEAKRWFDEATAEIDTAKWDLRGDKFGACCFWSQQAAEKAIKAFLMSKGERPVFEHSVSLLVQKSAAYDPTFAALTNAGLILDRYYIPTRYPNGLPYPSVPSKSFTKDDATKAISLAESILQKVRDMLP